MLTLYNTLTKSVEPVEQTDGRLSMYVCGVTPYDTTHLGHAFAYVIFDVLLRYLRSQGIDVRYAQNVTDIDDDILRKAKELGIAYDELAARETAQFKADMRALNVLDPDEFVPATSIMPKIVEAVQSLLQSGIAYESGGNIYFSNSAYPSYGAAVGDRSEMLRLASEHGGYPEDPNKRDPLDFLLWQKHLPGEPAWESPFGPGRPGWHIECTAIALSSLGFPVDIHGGGTDLIFPHHASEIAQAETLMQGSPFVRHWMHNAMVRMDGEKMSKSLGNMVFVRDLVKSHPSDAIRLYLLSHHYREPFEWDRRELEESTDLARKLKHARAAVHEGVAATDIEAELSRYLDEDFRTDRVIARLADLTSHADAAELAGAIFWAEPVLGLTFAGAPEPQAVPA